MSNFLRDMANRGYAWLNPGTAESFPLLFPYVAVNGDGEWAMWNGTSWLPLDGINAALETTSVEGLLAPHERLLELRELLLDGIERTRAALPAK